MSDQPTSTPEEPVLTNIYHESDSSNSGSHLRFAPPIDEPIDDGKLRDDDTPLPGDAETREYHSPETPPIPVTSTPRFSTAEFLSMTWGAIGLGLVQTGVDLPVGRVMQFQAPIAGSKLDELIKGTFIDALLQPLVKGVDKAEGFGALIGFPILIALYERNEALAPVLEPMIRQVVSSTLVEMAPAIKKQQTKEQRAAKAIADVTQAFDLQDNATPVDAVLAMIFAPPPGMDSTDG